MEMDTIGSGVSIIPKGAMKVRFCRNEFGCCTNY
jgi:hypothetical protein